MENRWLMLFLKFKIKAFPSLTLIHLSVLPPSHIYFQQYWISEGSSFWALIYFSWFVMLHFVWNPFQDSLGRSSDKRKVWWISFAIDFDSSITAAGHTGELYWNGIMFDALRRALFISCFFFFIKLCFISISWTQSMLILDFIFFFFFQIKNRWLYFYFITCYFFFSAATCPFNNGKHSHFLVLIFYVYFCYFFFLILFLIAIFTDRSVKLNWPKRLRECLQLEKRDWGGRERKRDKIN